MLQILLHKSYKLRCQLSSTKSKRKLIYYVIDKGQFYNHCYFFNLFPFFLVS